MRLTNLADVLRSAGLKVIEVPGWKTRGTELTDVQAIICHHTAGPSPAAGNYPSLGTVRDGRPDVPGPLSQLGLGYDGTWYVIAAGRANHAGITSKSWQTSSHSIGIEAEARGTGAKTDWPDVQMRSYERGVAALAKAFRVPNARVLGHKEIAAGVQGGPVNGRKIDPSFNMNTFRAAVARGPEQEDDMSAAAEKQIDDLHRLLLRKEADGSQPAGDTVELQRRDLIISRRNEGRLQELVASNRAQAAAIETLAKSVGVDPAVITKTVATAVDKALADVELTLTPKES